MTGQFFLRVLALVSCVSSLSCEKKTAEPAVKGKIGINALFSRTNQVYDNGRIISSFTSDSSSELNISSWMSTTDCFIGVKDSCVVQVDVAGRVIKTIYKPERDVRIWPLYTSRDDRYLLCYLFQNVNAEEQPFEALSPLVSLQIIDVDNGTVFKSFDSFERLPSLQINESPWLYNKHAFVYSIGNSVQFVYNKEVVNQPQHKEYGTYIYNLASGKHSLLISHGYYPVASPVTNQIAYKKDNAVFVLDMDKMKTKKIYESGRTEKISEVHWTPDGASLYFTYKYYWGIAGLFHTGERLIDCSTGEEKPFRSIGHGFQSYTWR